MDLSADNIMSCPVVSVSQATTVRELMGVLNNKHISGVPVVDEGGDLVGVVSITDLLSFGVNLDSSGNEHSVSDFHTSPAMDGLAQINSLLEPNTDVMDHPIQSLMSPNVVTAEERTPIGELADILVSRKIHRLVIVRNKKAVGIVSVGDILRALRDNHYQGA